MVPLSGISVLNSRVIFCIFSELIDFAVSASSASIEKALIEPFLSELEFSENTQDNSTFYQKTGRDHLGRKIRK